MRTQPTSSQRKTLTATRHGMLMTLDNRRISRFAKLAGAPEDKAAGVELHVRIGDVVSPGTPLCTVHAESKGELEYALAYFDANFDMFCIAEP